MMNHTSPSAAQVSALVLAKMAAGMDVIEALKAVCGAENVDRMISDIYRQLRGEVN